VPVDVELSPGAVVDAAVELLPEVGLDALSLSVVARRLGVTQPALYRHLAGIDDLWRRLGIRGRAELAAALTEAAIGRSGPEAVRATAEAWRRFTRTNPELYAATDRHPCGDDPELEAAVMAVVEVLALALRGYGLEGAAAVDAARALRSALHGFVHLELVDGHPHDGDRDASFEAMVDMLCVGFADLANRTGAAPDRSAALDGRTAETAQPTTEEAP
jgi:AcrR family transcriptional regulator